MENQDPSLTWKVARGGGAKPGMTSLEGPGSSLMGKKVQQKQRAGAVLGSPRVVKEAASSRLPGAPVGTALSAL